MNCRYCPSEDVIKRGRGRQGQQSYYCHKCGKYFSDDILDSFPAVLFFDIETLPIIRYAWQAYDDNASPEQVIKDWCILSWSAKWFGDDRIISNILKPDECKTRNDKRLMDAFWPLLDQADIVIAQNGRRFDVKKVNTRFAYHKLTPPSSFKVIDTLDALK